MLDSLSEKLQGIFGDLKSKGRLTEGDINLAMREIRVALSNSLGFGGHNGILVLKKA